MLHDLANAGTKGVGGTTSSPLTRFKAWSLPSAASTYSAWPTPGAVPPVCGPGPIIGVAVSPLGHSQLSLRWGVPSTESVFSQKILPVSPSTTNTLLDTPATITRSL